MAYLKERVAYLKGLAEGMQINDSTKEGKLLKAIIEVLDDMALAVDDVEEVQERLSEQIDNIDEDLAEIERLMFDEDDEGYVGEFECPYCNETFTVTEDMLEGKSDKVECPNCHKEIDVEWECDCDECTEQH